MERENFHSFCANSFISFSESIIPRLIEQGIILILVQQLSRKDEFVVAMSIRGLLNVLDDNTKEVFEQADCYSAIVKLIFESPSALVRSDALTGMVTVTEKSTPHLIKFAQEVSKLSSRKCKKLVTRVTIRLQNNFLRLH